MRRARVPLELQSETNECGLACLAMVMGCYDPDVRLSLVRRRFPQYRRGATLGDLKRLAGSLGYSARGLRAEPRQLKKLRLPAILHWDLNHFVVLVRVSVRGCVVHDPAIGRVRVAWPALGKRFTGVALELWPDGGRQVRARTTPRLRLRDLWASARLDRGEVLWVLLLSVLAQAFLLLGPLQLQWIVDEALAAGDVDLLTVLALGFTWVLVLRTATDWLRGVLVVHLGAAVTHQLAATLLERLLRLPLSWFEARRVGDIASRFASVGPLRDFVAQDLAGLVVDGLVMAFALLLMLAYAPQLAGIVLLWHVGYLFAYVALAPSLQHAPQ